MLLKFKHLQTSQISLSTLKTIKPDAPQPKHLELIQIDTNAHKPLKLRLLYQTYIQAKAKDKATLTTNIIDHTNAKILMSM